VAVMGKNQTRGHRGLYLKGKGVVWVQDFVLNLISNRIEYPLEVCSGFGLIFYYNLVSFLHPEVFTKHEMRPGRHSQWVRATGCPGSTVHAGNSGWPTVSRARWGCEHERRRPRAHGARSRRWQWPLGRLLGQAGPRKTLAGWVGFKGKLGFGPWSNSEGKTFLVFQIFIACKFI
jgi:hypothetical protein